MEGQYSKAQMDAFRELGNVGVGNAATSLSKLINKKVEIDIPETKLIPLERFSEEVGGAELIVVCTYLKVTGDFYGQALLLFSEKSSLEMADLMMGKEKGTTQKMSEEDMSSFTEMANIIVGSYLNSIANMLNLSIFPQPPLTANDMAQAVLDAILAKIGKRGDKLLSIKTSMDIEGNNIDGTFIMLFEKDSLDLMIKKLNEKYDANI